jgi:hypothetical protein
MSLPEDRDLMVSLLEKTLEQVRGGIVESLAIVTTTAGDCTGSGYLIGTDSGQAKLLGSLQLCSTRIIREEGLEADAFGSTCTHGPLH